MPGEAHALQLSNAPLGALPVLIWGLQEAAIPFDEGTLYIADPHLIDLPPVDVTGKTGFLWNVPNDPTLCGLEMVTQVMFVDAGAIGALQTAQTHAIRLGLGF